MNVSKATWLYTEASLDILRNIIVNLMTTARDVTRQECCRHNTCTSYYKKIGIFGLLKEEKEAWVV